MSRQTPPRAMPKTPWPPRSRSMTSSSEVHSKTETPSLISVTWVMSSTPRARRCSMAVRICCSEMPASISRLITLSIRMSRKLYSRWEPEPDAPRTSGTTRPVRAQ